MRVQALMALDGRRVDRLPTLRRSVPAAGLCFCAARKSIHQELIVKRILAIALTSILASAMAFAQDASSTTSTGSADQSAASSKKAKKHAKKHHAKKAKSSKAAPASTETAPK